MLFGQSRIVPDAQKCMILYFGLILMKNSAIINRPGRDRFHSSMARIEDGAKKNYFSRFSEELLPNERIPEAFIINKPMTGSVGGDGYWVHEKGEVTYIAVFDCMGHGHLASMMTRIYTNALKKVVVDHEIDYAGSILRYLHHEIEVKFGGKEDKQLSTGADFGVVKIDRSRREMEFAGAKMDLYQVTDGTLNVVKADRMQVGEMFEYRHDYNTIDIDIKKPGASTFYLMSDGIKDLIGGPSDKKLGSAGVKNLFESNHDKPMEEQKEFIINFIDDWAGSNKQFDDIVLVGFSL